MNKYQIINIAKNSNNAGSKAPADIADIAEQMYYKKVPICMNTTVASKVAKIQRQIGYFIDWDKCYKTIQNNSIVLLQHPFRHHQLTRNYILKKLKEKKKVKYISLIHDVEKLRKCYYKNYYKKEFEFMIDIADIIIAHNDTMKHFFIKEGFPKERIVNLCIFDYLQKSQLKNEPKFEKSITIAGNLDVRKSAYIGQLGNIRNVTVNLFGSNFSYDMKKYGNIKYHGSFPPDEVPSKLTSGFGLVWDGNSINQCDGDTGQYLKYNNPHKLSLYLSSGLPVVIWSKAAEANFVLKNNVGICVDSLMDLDEKLNSFDSISYQKLVNNVKKISDLLINGHYAKKAIKKAEILIGE